MIVVPAVPDRGDRKEQREAQRRHAARRAHEEAVRAFDRFLTETYGMTEAEQEQYYREQYADGDE